MNKLKSDVEFFNKAAASICDAIRQDHFSKVADHEIDPGEFISKFKKRFRTFLSTLPDQDKMYNSADAIVSNACDYAWIWCGRNMEHLMEINTFLFQDLGFEIYEWDPDDGMYVEFMRQTEKNDYFITVSKAVDCYVRFPFRSINETTGLMPTNCKVTLTVYNKNRHSENYKKDVRFKNLPIEMDKEFELLLTLLNKFIGKVV